MKIKRLAIALFFFINGFLFANWVARIPEVQSFFEINNSLLGGLLLVSAFGAILAMPLAAGLSLRFPTAQITRISGLVFCTAVSLLVLFPNIYVSGFFFFVLGFSTGTLDVTMNAQALYLERQWTKPIMSSFHAVFSIGTALGAGSGAIFTWFGIPLWLHFLILSIASIFVIFWASYHLLEDPIEANSESSKGEGHFRLPTRAILPLGLIAFCGMTGEGSMSDWSALFMHQVLGQNAFYSALAFGAFASAMTLGRLLGDFYIHRYGAYNVLLCESLLALVGLTLVLVSQGLFLSLLGFCITGLGLATIVPIVYSQAGNSPGLNPTVGISMATTIGYSGFFIAPPLIGYISDWSNLRMALGFTWVLFMLMVFLSGLEYRKKKARVL